MKNIYISHYALATKCIGPFNRNAIWLCGCSKRCVGCLDSNSERNEGEWVSIDKLAKILTVGEAIEGITISGGEPFEQIDGLYELLIKIKDLRDDFGIIVYTGWMIHELYKLKDKKVKGILSMIDMLIDGEYKNVLNDNRALVGSSNQNIILLTNRYKSILEKYYGVNAKRRIEVRITHKGMQMIGVPTKDSITLWKQLSGRGIE
jgi:anaerobic ribonucleoside-triphosphate reductase activating protein